MPFPSVSEGDMRGEFWLPVVGYEGLYEVSNTGRVRSLYRPYKGGGPGRVLKLRVIKGYNYAHLSTRETGAKKVRVCRMVLDAFVGPQPDLVARHGVEGSLKDNLENLSWGTHAENSADMVGHGTVSRGSAHGGSKLSEEQVKYIRANVSKRGDRVRIAKELNISPTLVSAIILRQVWKHI